MDIDYQYEQYLIGQAIAQCEAGEGEHGYAADFLLKEGVCPHCYRDLALQTIGVCGNPECAYYQVPQC